MCTCCEKSILYNFPSLLKPTPQGPPSIKVVPNIQFSNRAQLFVYKIFHPTPTESNPPTIKFAHPNHWH